MYNNQLEVFVAAAEEGSFSKAAEKLYITTTAVMKHMNNFENNLGFKIIKRSNHGIKLTTAGEALYKDCRFIMDYYEKAVDRAGKLAKGEEYKIRVGTSLLNPCKPFMDIWNKVNDKFSQFKIEIIPFEDNNESIISVIEKIGNKFDFIVGVCDSAQWLKRCSFYEIGKCKMCLAVAGSHPLADKKVFSLDDIHGEKLMMIKRGDSFINDLIRDKIEKNHPQIFIDDTPYFYDINVFNRCEQMNSVLLTLDMWEDVHPSLVTIPVKWDYEIPYGLMYPLEPKECILDFMKAVEEMQR